MSADHQVFFAYVRNAPFGGRLTRAQVAAMEAMLAAWDKHGDGDLRKLANGFAQCFRETGGRMVPVRETIASLPEEAQEEWEYAVEVRRDNPTLNAGWEALGGSQDALDDLFRVAASL
jgi:hypothetical protein